MENLVMQSIEYNRGICLIDPHGDLVNTVMTRIPRERIEKGNVILLDPKDTSFPFGLNIYHCEDKDDPVAVEYTTNLVMDLYKKLWKAEYSQPMVEDVILMTTLTIIANNMTMVEVPRLLFDDAFRQQLVKNVRNPDVLDFWKIYDNPRSIEREQGGGTIGRRIRQFTSSGIMRYIVGQSEKSLRLRDILDQRKILLIRLYSDLPQLTSLIGSTIVSQMLQAALSRSDTDKRPTVHLYCDEYSRFAVESFAQIISEAGKYNIIPFIAHQSRGQISEENQDSAIQLGSLFAFRLIGIDAEVIANEFNLDPAKLPPTIPRNVLDYIDRHPSDVVKDFAGGYILRLRNALGKKEKRETFPDVGSFEYGPYHDFGEGEVEFKPDRAQDAFNLIETLLYEAMRQESIPQTELRQVITEMAPLLKYEYYYAWHYLQDFSDYVQNEKAIHSKADKALKWREPDIPKLLEKVNLNDYDLAWVLFGENEKKTKEEVWQHLVKNAEEKRRWFPPTMHELLESIESTTYVLLRNALEEWEKRNDTATHRTIRQFSKTWKNPISLLIPDENKETIVVDGIGVFTVATVRQALSSDEAFVTFIATHDINSRYSKKSKEEIWTMFSGIVESNKGYLENRAAPKAIMREKREEISNELVKLQNEVEKAKADRDAQLADRLQMHQRKLEAAKDRHDRFVNMLMEVLNILKTPGDKIEATPTIIATQQTYADRKNQIANELVHLQRGQAMVKLPTGECLIQTYHPNEVEQLQQAQRLEDEEATKKQEAIKQLVEEKARSKRENKQIIIEHTRRNYCKPHAEVEAEIRRRQDGGEPSLSITRKHQV